MRIPARVAAALGAAMSAAALTIALAVPAMAATGWRVVFTHHYGAQNNASGYLTVVAPGTHNAWAFGGTDLSGATPGAPVAEHWNGTSWRASTLPSGLSTPIEAASAPAGNDIWAVTEFSGDILHWNGTSWRVAHKLSGSGQLLTGVTAFSTSNVWVFGTSGFGPGFGTWHYNGSTWRQVTGTGGGISVASAVSSSNIWAIGSTSSPESDIVHYNGSGWRQATGTALTGLQFMDILAKSKTSIWATATSQTNGFTSYLVHFNGSSWSRTKLPWAVDPGSMTRDGHGGFWLSATDSSSRSWMVHRSSTGLWSRTLIGSAPTVLFDPVLIPGTTSLWGAGEVTASAGTNAAIWANGQIP